MNENTSKRVYVVSWLISLYFIGESKIKLNIWPKIRSWEFINKLHMKVLMLLLYEYDKAKKNFLSKAGFLYIDLWVILYCNFAKLGLS